MRILVACALNSRLFGRLYNWAFPSSNEMQKFAAYYVNNYSRPKANR